MARVTVTIPDAAFAEARAHGLDLSAVVSAALALEISRALRIDALRRYLADLDDELVPVSEQVAARAWASKLCE